MHYAELRACYMLSPVRPSVCPSRMWISQKRLKLGSCNFHHRVAQLALMPLTFEFKFNPEILTDFPWAGASNKVAMGKTTYFLALCVDILKRYDIRLIGSCICTFDWHKGRWPMMTLNCDKFKFSRNFALLRSHFWKAHIPTLLRFYLCVRLACNIPSITASSSLFCIHVVL